jgi:hypothetical protein
LISAGLTIQSFNEFPFSVDFLLPFMVKGRDGYYRLRDTDQELPLMFSIEATK